MTQKKRKYLVFAFKIWEAWAVVLITVAMLAVALAACDTGAAAPLAFRHEPCPAGFVCQCVPDPGGSSSSGGESSGSSGHSTSTGLGSSSGSDSSDSGSISTGPATAGTAGRTGGFDCPATITPGINTFCGGGLPCRDVLIEQSGNAGPLAVYWYGTNGSIASVRNSSSSVVAVANMAAAEGGIFALPEADPAAIVRPNGNIFPWWIVGDHDDPSEETTRQDDFLLMDALVDCLAGSYDAARISTGGASAGAIMSSYMLAQRDYLAGAVSWSGGTAFGEPMVPLGTASAMVIHGGEPDQYCGAGVTECYDFVGPSFALANDMVDAGHFAFLCDFGEGRTVPPWAPQDTHTDAMGDQGAAFMALASTGGHPWATAGVGPLPPNVPGPQGWMIDHYCYTVDGPHADWGL